MRNIVVVGKKRLSNNDGDKATRKQKSNWFRLAKQQLCTCITLFCTFLSFHCTFPNFRFYGGRKHKTTIFFLFVKLDTVLYNSAAEKIANVKFETLKELE